MEYLSNTGAIDIQNSDPTSYFSRAMNNVFDSMNTKRYKNDNKFKRAIDINKHSEASELFAFFTGTIQYIKTLKFNRVRCVQSRRKTGFFGLIINIIIVYYLYLDRFR